MFQHYRSVSSTFTSATLSLSHSGQCPSLSLSVALRSLSPKLTPTLAVCMGKCVYRYSPLLRWYGFLSSQFHKQNFLLLQGFFFDLFLLDDLERSFFSGTYFACEDEFSNAND